MGQHVFHHFLNLTIQYGPDAGRGHFFQQHWGPLEALHPFLVTSSFCGGWMKSLLICKGLLGTICTFSVDINT